MSATLTTADGEVRPLFAAAHHPLVVTARGGALSSYVAAHRAAIADLLLQHGGVLFRGFDASGADGLRMCAEALGATPFEYVGGNTPRTSVAADVFTSTEFPATETIALHNEMSYLPAWPRRVFFSSLVPARTGGQTSLASSVDVLRALPAALVDRFREHKVRYIRHFHSRMRLGKSWQDTYRTTDREEVARIAAAQGSTCEWLAGDVLRVATTCEAVVAHPVTGDLVWFNQAEQWHPSALPPASRAMFESLVGADRMPHTCAYGDGAPIDDEALTTIRRVLQDHKLLFDWQPHDLLVLDNVLMMHGREAYTGDRRTLAYLSAT